MLNNKKQINMKTLNLKIKSDIHTRDEIRNLLDLDILQDLKDVKEIVIDMEQCAFVSRSPAHELTKLIKKFETDYGIKVTLNKLQYEVEKMITVVNQSLTNTKTETKIFDFIVFKDNKQFYNELEKI